MKASREQASSSNQHSKRDRESIPRGLRRGSATSGYCGRSLSSTESQPSPTSPSPARIAAAPHQAGCSGARALSPSPVSLPWLSTTADFATLLPAQAASGASAPVGDAVVAEDRICTNALSRARGQWRRFGAQADKLWRQPDNREDCSSNSASVATA
ncbi:hypothetical protein PIB30_051346 [Stylosanthes scabra]|uniref:Uncharacterized protein n=1 Tax=Stylosanthes scabra TaxID=79078 RepID=A0ABU6XI44_9FABA|nr:hypothetical protein [Stylosanthes scabra]